MSLAVVLVLTRLSNNQVSGVPVAAPTPPAPAADQCIDESKLDRTVSCAAPHTAEIIAAWGAQDAHVLSHDLGALKRDCWARGQAYLAPLGLSRPDPYAGVLPPRTWSPVPLIVDTDIVTSASGALPDPWVACIAKPRSAVTPDVDAPLAAVGAFSGDLTLLVPMAARPLNLRSCFELRASLPATVSCRSWHRGEVFATRSAPAGQAAASDPDITACRALVAAAMDTADPTRGGQLSIAVDSQPATDQINRLPSAQQTDALLRCVVEATDGRFLTDSVIGLADNPVPLN